MLPSNGTLPVLMPQPPLLPAWTHISDHWVLLILPIATYWAASLFFHYLDTHDLLPQYRLHTPAELASRNRVSRRDVVRDVVLQQLIQTVVGGVTALFEGVDMVGDESLHVRALHAHLLAVERAARAGLSLFGLASTAAAASAGDWRLAAASAAYYYVLPLLRLGLAIFILDTWQYFLHRLMHESKWLYRTFHSRHHRLYVPYAFGALYNHPVEGLLMDTIGAGLGYKLSGMGTRGAMIFFCFSTLKTVDDHCGYSLPWDPLQRLFWNNARYHDVHHQTWGVKTNFSQPFLICWDRWLGTQWTGGDLTARYAAQRARADAALEAKAPVPSPHEPASKENGAPNGSRKANGVTTSANGLISRHGHGHSIDNGNNASDSDNGNNDGNGNGIAATSGFANGNGNGHGAAAAAKTLALKINGHSPLTGLRELTPPSDPDVSDSHDEAAPATSTMADEEDVRRIPRKRMATRAA